MLSALNKINPLAGKESYEHWEKRHEKEEAQKRAKEQKAILAATKRLNPQIGLALEHWLNQGASTFSPTSRAENRLKAAKYICEYLKQYDGKSACDSQPSLALWDCYLGDAVLNDLAPIILDLPNLQALTLYDLQLCQFPLWATQLRNLSDLYLSTNRIETLPDDLHQLSRLEHLDLTNNPLQVLPESLGHLTNLKTLTISGNRFTALPEALGRLTKLEKLDAEKCQNLKSLPQSLSGLTKLTRLKLAYCGFEGFPEWIAQHPATPRQPAQPRKWDELALEGNPLKRGMLSPAFLQFFINHDLSTTKIFGPGITRHILKQFTDTYGLAEQSTQAAPQAAPQAPPQALPQADSTHQILYKQALQQTKHLDFSGHPVNEFPAEILQFRALETLCFRRNSLAVLPPTISNLTALEHLDLSFNQLTVLPQELNALSRLKRLNLGHNQLNQLPALALPQLQELNLQSNQFKSLPDPRLEPNQLTRIHLNNNQLTDVPRWVATLPNLRHVYVAGNPLERLPASLAGNHLSKVQDVPQDQVDALIAAGKAQEKFEEFASELKAWVLTNPEMRQRAEGLILNAYKQNAKKLTLRNLGIDVLPEVIKQLTRLEELNLEGNRLSVVPDFLSGLPHLKSLNLTNNRIGAVPAWLQAEGCSVQVVWAGNPIDQVHPTIRQWLEGTDLNHLLSKQLWHDFMETPDSRTFLTWLERMAGSSDFKNAASKPVLIAEMGKILNLLRQVPELRELCFAVAREALSSCHDRVALALNDMHMHVIDYRARNGEYNQTQLLDLGQGFYRLHLLDRIILNKITEIQTRINVEATQKNWTAEQTQRALAKIEEIEIKLAYQTGLKAKLMLPIQTQNMLFRNLAPVKNEEIKRAGENILEQEKAKNYRGLIDFLVDWVPWKNHILRTDPIVKECIDQLTETINEASYASLESSTQSSEQGSMSQQEYREEVERVQKSREQQLRNLLLMVTATAVSVRKP